MISTPSSRRADRGTEAPYRRGNRRETAILDSLEELLETKPLAAITNDDIAKGAGISRPTLYFYFSSRSEAFVALLSRTLTELSAPPRELFRASDRSPKDEIVGLLRHVLRSWQEHGTVLSRAVEAAEDPAVNHIWQESMAINVAILSDWIRRGRAEGKATDTGDNPDELAEALAWMVERGYYQLFRREHSRIDQERQVETFATILLRSTGHADPR